MKGLFKVWSISKSNSSNLSQPPPTPLGSCMFLTPCTWRDRMKPALLSVGWVRLKTVEEAKIAVECIQTVVCHLFHKKRLLTCYLTPSHRKTSTYSTVVDSWSGQKISLFEYNPKLWFHAWSTSCFCFDFILKVLAQQENWHMWSCSKFTEAAWIHSLWTFIKYKQVIVYRNSPKWGTLLYIPGFGCFYVKFIYIKTRVAAVSHSNMFSSVPFFLGLECIT